MFTKNSIRTISSLLVFTSLHLTGFAQSQFTRHILADPFISATSLFIADVDADGDADILAGSGTQGIYWFENMGEKPARFTSHVIDPVFRKCFTVVAGDLDQDGQPDVIAGSWEDHDIACYRRQVDGTWSKSTIESNLTNVHELFIQDIDLDSKPDILAAGAGVDQVVWYRNAGSGQWVKNIVSNSFGGIRSVSAADLDGDGDIDIAGGASDDHDVAVWINQGGTPIQWNKVTVADNFTGSHRIQIADINLDGRPDILGAAWGVNEVAWWENTGNPAQWMKHTIDNSMPLAMTALAMDYDLDGDMDIAATGIGNQVAWYENQKGDCSLWRKKILDTQLGSPWPLTAGDFDGDRDIDLVAGGDAGNQIRWYENELSGVLNGCLITPSGKFNLGVFIPEADDSPQKPSLLIALPGASEPRDYLMLRDALIPVGENRLCIIMTPDFPRAESPGYQWVNSLYIGSVLNFALERFFFDPEQVYIMGFEAQGKPVLSAAQQAGLKVRGFIGFNPFIPFFDEAEWPHLAVPAVVAVSEVHPNLSAIQNLVNHYAQDQPLLSLLKYNGTSLDYQTGEFPDLTIQCMDLVDAAYSTGISDRSGIDRIPQLSINILNQNGVATLQVQSENTGAVDLAIFDILGKKRSHMAYALNGRSLVIPLSDLLPHQDGGIYLIQATDGKGRISSRKVLITK
jgi:hypothetical protein